MTFPEPVGRQLGNRRALLIMLSSRKIVFVFIFVYPEYR